ncbi:glycosyltransferase family 4 protein [Bradyrhizobium sp. URHA0013]|uniref:glycosyltransferase family 4 protein n=1 Tax=Bradyrhizobium sp. URHA0013 TaxID=1380352 RepID=UPI00068433EF|nr:glycosyltransferase family 4 protein [Bradyrhizobium sp. URHA0013]
MRVAIVHDWLMVQGGAEQVLREIIKLFPRADLFTLVCHLPEDRREFLSGLVPRTSFIQNLPFSKTKYRSYLAFFPIAIEQFDLAEYDLVISSSYAAAKGVITGPNQLHVSYVHSPVRFAWDLQAEYLRESRLDSGLRSIIARTILHYIRMWDVRTAHGVDTFVANSQFVARRIMKTYGRKSEVIHPPVDTEYFRPGPGDRSDFYLTASRMVPYKRIPLIVEAFASMPDKRLIVIGDGPEISTARAVAGSNVTIMGYQPKNVLLDHMQRARAFVFAAEEDFGIIPVEAQACGTPVIAYGRGGSLETVRGDKGPGRTGIHFHEQTMQSVKDAIREFESLSPAITADDCRQNALKFSRELFSQRFRDTVDTAAREHGVNWGWGASIKG